MNDDGLPFKLFTNEWDKVKSSGCPRNWQPAQVNSLKRELNLQDKMMEIKLIREFVDKRRCEEFEMALQHKSKLRAYKEFEMGGWDWGVL